MRSIDAVFGFGCRVNCFLSSDRVANNGFHFVRTDSAHIGQIYLVMPPGLPYILSKSILLYIGLKFFLFLKSIIIILYSLCLSQCFSDFRRSCRILMRLLPGDRIG